MTWCVLRLSDEPQFWGFCLSLSGQQQLYTLIWTCFTNQHQIKWMSPFHPCPAMGLTLWLTSQFSLRSLTCLIQHLSKKHSGGETECVFKKVVKGQSVCGTSARWSLQLISPPGRSFQKEMSGTFLLRIVNISRPLICDPHLKGSLGSLVWTCKAKERVKKKPPFHPPG